MKISGEQSLPASRERVWELFNNPDRLRRLIPGCEKLEQPAHDEFTGTINVGITAIKAQRLRSFMIAKNTGTSTRT
jgi:uncharacterized protein